MYCMYIKSTCLHFCYVSRKAVRRKVVILKCKYHLLLKTTKQVDFISFLLLVLRKDFLHRFVHYPGWLLCIRVYFVYRSRSLYGLRFCIWIIRCEGLCCDSVPCASESELYLLKKKKKKSFWLTYSWRQAQCLKPEVLNQWAALPGFSHSLELEASNLNCSVPVHVEALEW